MHMETPIDFSNVNFEEGLFTCPSPLPLEQNDPDFPSVISNGSSPISSPLSPHLSLVSSQGDLVIDNYVPPEPRISPIPSNETPTSSCTKIYAHTPRSPIRDRELVTHNVRVNPQELKDKLTERGHGDKIEALDGLLGQIDEFITFRQIYGDNRDTRSGISPPEPLGAPYFAPFLKKRHESDESHTNRGTLLYVCLFCGHELSNRTQMVQHLMAGHLRYFPHECHECDATFSRRADLIKHGKDKHSGLSVVCRCGKTFSNQRNYQRHQRLKKGDLCPN